MTHSTTTSDRDRQAPASARRPRRIARRAGLAAAATLALGVGLAASPAAARNDFANGFEDELGRIVAHQVARIGREVVAVGYYDRGPYGDEGFRHHRPYRYERRHHRYDRRRHRYERRHCRRHHHVRKVVIREYDSDCGRHRGYERRFHRYDH